MKHIKYSCLTICLLLSSFAAQADVARGKLLLEQNCFKCHDTSVYSRPDRRIKSLAALQAQVTRCPKTTGAKWNQKQIADVVKYLNKEFYHFK